MPEQGRSLFEAPPEAYDRYVGRYAPQLADAFIEAVGIAEADRALDVGCGTGALIGALAERLGAANVAGIDPSETWIETCRMRVPAADVRLGRAEDLPFAAGEFGAVLSQLVINFVPDPARAATEMRRVARPGGVVAACVWDYTGGMTMLRTFWDAAIAIDPDAIDSDEGRAMRLGRPGELAELLEGAGMGQVHTGGLDVSAAYEDFDDFWTPFLSGVGPAGSYCAGLDDDRREALRAECARRLGTPDGPFELGARAWYVRGIVEA